MISQPNTTSPQLEQSSTPAPSRSENSLPHGSRVRVTPTGNNFKSCLTSACCLFFCGCLPVVRKVYVEELNRKLNARREFYSKIFSMDETLDVNLRWKQRMDETLDVNRTLADPFR